MCGGKTAEEEVLMCEREVLSQTKITHTITETLEK